MEETTFGNSSTCASCYFRVVIEPFHWGEALFDNFMGSSCVTYFLLNLSTAGETPFDNRENRAIFLLLGDFETFR